jgi:hypothetical protein
MSFIEEGYILVDSNDNYYGVYGSKEAAIYNITNILANKPFYENVAEEFIVFETTEIARKRTSH